jgi:GNAT superfamily N-acetyltransferase
VKHTLDVKIRAVIQEEIRERAEVVRWIFSSWLRSYFESEWAPDKVHMARHHDLISDLLLRSEVLVAHLPGEPDLFAGWICAERTAIHYCYVKHPYRRDGVATRLLQSLTYGPQAYTHPAAKKIMVAAARHGFHYDPYVLMLRAS